MTRGRPRDRFRRIVPTAQPVNQGPKTTEDMSVLRADYAASRKVLFGGWKIPVKRLMSNFICPPGVGVDLLMLKKTAKPIVGKRFYDSQDHLAKISGSRSFGGRHVSRKMRLNAGMSSGQCARRFGFRPAHRTRDGQYLPQRKLWVCTPQLFSIAGSGRCSIMLCRGPRMDCGGWRSLRTII